MSQKNWIVIGILIIVIALLVFFARTQKTTISTKPSTNSHKQLTGLDIAKQIAIFLDKNMLPDGDFNTEYLCFNSSSQNPGCQLSTLAQSAQLKTSNGFISSAYDKLYQKTKDPHYRESAEKAIAFILSSCATDLNYCSGSVPSLYYWYTQTHDQKYKDAILKVADNSLNDQSLSSIVRGRKGRSLWSLYDLTGDLRYKDLLVKTADDLMADKIDGTDTQYPFGPAIYKEGDFEVKAYQVIAAGNIYVGAYHVTKDPIYLKAAQDFFDKAKVDLHAGDINRIGNSLNLNIILFLQDLAEISDSPKKEVYLNQARVLAQDALTNFWDSPENQKFNGDYGFITLVDNNISHKAVGQNGLRLLQFVDLSDQTFHLP